MRRWLPTLVGAVLFTIAAGFCIATYIDERERVAAELAEASSAWLAVAVVLSASAMSWVAWRWRACLEALDTDPSAGQVMRWYYLGELGKYVPGGIWPIVGRGELSHRGGIGRTVSYQSVALSLTAWYGAAVLPVAVLVAHPNVQGFVARLVRRVSDDRIDLAVLPWGRLVALVASYVPAWLLIGAVTAAVVSAYGGEPGWRSPVVAVVAWVVGFLAVPVPAGAGVREAVSRRRQRPARRARSRRRRHRSAGLSSPSISSERRSRLEGWGVHECGVPRHLRLVGRGGSRAGSDLEDLGWFVIDNVPLALIPKVGELAAAPGSVFDRVALVVRVGTAGLDEIREAITSLRASARDVRVLFLDASTEVLIRRYEDTRRRHPFADEGDSLAAAIGLERRLLEPLKGEVDVVVDTSSLNVHQLSDRMRDLFGPATPGDVRINVVSFGYKHGLPLDVDLVLDCRFLPNPHWVDELRPLTGLDDAVREYVLGQPEAASFLEHLDALLTATLPAYVREGRTYLSIALGCTGGRHRSVVMAGAVADLLRSHGLDPSVTHRDVDR